jgi:hypothetical protein
MAKKVLKNVEIWFPKLKKAESFKGSELAWSIQIRTKDEDQAADWEERGFSVKKIRPDKKKGEDFEPFFRANIKRKVKKGDGTEREPAKVVDKSLSKVDPMTIGNGSIGHVQYMPWEMEREGSNISGRILEAIQITKLVPYEPKGDGEYEDDEDFDLLDSDDEDSGNKDIY